MRDHIFSKKYLRRKLIFITPIITGILHFYWNNRKVYTPEYNYVKTPSLNLEYTEWKPRPRSYYTKPVLQKSKCNEIDKKKSKIFSASDFDRFIDFHAHRERKIWIPKPDDTNDVFLNNEYIKFRQIAMKQLYESIKLVKKKINSLKIYVETIKFFLDLGVFTMTSYKSSSAFCKQAYTKISKVSVDGAYAASNFLQATFFKAMDWVSKGSAFIYSFFQNDDQIENDANNNIINNNTIIIDNIINDNFVNDDKVNDDNNNIVNDNIINDNNIVIDNKVNDKRLVKSNKRVNIMASNIWIKIQSFIPFYNKRRSKIKEGKNNTALVKNETPVNNYKQFIVYLKTAAQSFYNYITNFYWIRR